MESATMIIAIMLLATFVFTLLIIEYFYEVRYLLLQVTQKVNRIFSVRRPDKGRKLY